MKTISTYSALLVISLLTVASSLAQTSEAELQGLLDLYLETRDDSYKHSIFEKAPGTRYEDFCKAWQLLDVDDKAGMILARRGDRSAQPVQAVGQRQKDDQADQRACPKVTHRPSPRHSRLPRCNVSPDGAGEDNRRRRGEPADPSQPGAGRSRRYRVRTAGSGSRAG